MIANEVQYRASRASLTRIEEAVTDLQRRAVASTDQQGRSQELGVLRARVADLKAEIAEYERLRSGTRTSFEAGSLAELAGAFVKARIAKGWTQRQLADALGVAEQQIQRYEATGYAAASLARLCDIAKALGTEVREVVTLGAVPSPESDRAGV